MYTDSIKIEYEIVSKIPKEAAPPTAAFKWYIK